MSDRLVTRRAFLADLGRGSAAIAIVSLTGGLVAACGSTVSSATPPASSGSAGSSTPGSSTAGPTPADTGSGPSATASQTAAGGSTASGGPLVPGGVAWARANLGFVSAYLLVRDGEGTIVDTGVAGSKGAIEAVVSALGLDWGDVSNVILTHKHPDHAGSINEVLEAAGNAAGWIGAADLAAVQASRPLTALADGDEVFGLQIVATPGHTASHVSVYDQVGGLLVAGDALRTDTGALAGSDPQFTADAAAARASVVKLGKLTFETLLVGHGEPILRGASAQVAALGGG